MKKIVAIALILVVAFGTVFAQGNKEQAQKPVEVKNYTFGGSTTVAPIVETAIPLFTAANPGVKISYEGVGTGTGLKQLTAGTLTLAGASRDLNSTEIADGLVPNTIALDGLSVAVNKSVTVANLSLAQLAGIFSGEISNWSQVGGPNAAIALIVRDESSGTYASFKEIVLDTQKKAPSKNAIVAKENGELAAKIASTPNSIGYLGMAFNHIVTEAGGKVLLVDGIESTTANVLNGSYPISRNLYLVSKGPLAGGSVEKAFVDFILSDKGAAVVLDAQYIPLN
ncbi:phosphate ABC transporter substrate-binding protein [Parasphaerochaeta coccoides]|nr:phosphate ABC transporter substrate-binding protein [Parasphaerochaeta coccoides]